MVGNKVLELQDASLDQIVTNLKVVTEETNKLTKQIIFVLGFFHIFTLWLVKFALLWFFTSIFSRYSTLSFTLTSRPGIKMFIRLTAIYLVIGMGACYL